MNFSVWQWRVAVVLDVLLKTALLYVTMVVVSLGTVILGGFDFVLPIFLMAASLSSLHFLCLFFGSRFVARLESTNAKLAHALKFVLVLVFANILFIISFTAVLSFNRNIADNAIGSLYVAATNLIPILLVAAVGRIAGLIGSLR